MNRTSEITLTDEQLEQFTVDGYVVVRGLYDPDEVDTLREAFMDVCVDGPVPGLSEINENYSTTDPLSRWPRMMHPHRHPELPVGPLAMEYLLHDRIDSVLRQLFGEEALAAQSMFYFKPPGARGQTLHQDNFYLRVSPGTCCAAWLAVDDADATNGGMMVVPGSNSLGIFCPEPADTSTSFTSEFVAPPPGLKPVPCDLKAGDVLFFNGSVIHGSTPNISKDKFRRAFICHYIPASSVEMSHWYNPLLRFDGTELKIADATGGGPCGTVAEPTSPH